MVQERSRAEKLQIADPVCDDYDATGKNYNKLVGVDINTFKYEFLHFNFFDNAGELDRLILNKINV